MTCKRCEQPASFRFCSNACFIAYVKDPRRAYVLCAICQYDPITKRIGNHETHRRCEDCTAGEENADWAQPSEYEQGSDDVDALVAISGGGVSLEALVGGKRKAATSLADRVLQIASTVMITRRRRRKTSSGWITRGWVTFQGPPNQREIAEMAGCSRAYVRKLLKRVLG